jgi:hypothetical protein
MDWATQPDPFRRYGGAELLHLPLSPAWQAPPYWQIYVPSEPLAEPGRRRRVREQYAQRGSRACWKGRRTKALDATSIAFRLLVEYGFEPAGHRRVVDANTIERANRLGEVGDAGVMDRADLPF